MPFTFGLVGLPNAGKTTIFNALAEAAAAVAPYPFCTVEPNVAVVEVPDTRLADLVRLTEAEKCVPAHVEFMDVAGLVQGASHGEGLGNTFLGTIRNVDVVLHVVRCFRDEAVSHEGAVDPANDVAVIDTELTLADLEIAERRMEKIRRQMRADPKDVPPDLHALERVLPLLQEGEPAAAAHLTREEADTLSAYGFLTSKPTLLVANVGEEGDPDAVAAVEALAAQRAAACVVISGQVESEIAQLAPAERADYLAAMGLAGSSLGRLITGACAALGLIVFYTVARGITTAWIARGGLSALDAAAMIHSDMAEGFIRADVVHCPDLVAAGGLHEAKAAGTLRSEGRDGPIGDGDVVYIHFHH